MNWKIILGLLLMLPLFVAIGYYAIFQFDHPEMTSTQLFDTIGFWPFIALIPALGGFILYCVGKDE